MSYQSESPYGSDWAKGAVDVVAVQISRTLKEEVADRLQDSASEQAILVLMQCLRKLAEDFPMPVQLAFGKKDYEQVKAGFHEWFDKCQKKIPVKYRKGLLEEAEAEFARWENEVLPRRSAK